MIYLCKMVGTPFIKIGYSEAPEKRYQILNGASPFDIICEVERSGSRDLEKAIHETCSDYAVKNEWYFDCEFVRSAFFEVSDPYPSAKSTRQMNLIKKRDDYQAKLAFSRPSKYHRVRYEKSVETLARYILGSNPPAMERGE